jgi:hypothetical protein
MLRLVIRRRRSKSDQSQKSQSVNDRVQTSVTLLATSCQIYVGKIRRGAVLNIIVVSDCRLSLFFHRSAQRTKVFLEARRFRVTPTWRRNKFRLACVMEHEGGQLSRLCPEAIA